MNKWKQKWLVLLSAGVVSLGGIFAVAMTVNKEETPKNNYVDLNELPDADKQDGSRKEDKDGKDVTQSGGNKQHQGGETDTGLTGEDQTVDKDTQGSEVADNKGTQNGETADGKGTEIGEVADNKGTQAGTTEDDKGMQGEETTDKGSHSGDSARTDSGDQKTVTEQFADNTPAKNPSAPTIPKQEEKDLVDTVETINPNVLAENLEFNAESKLVWPVKGNVVLGYSADHVIYHPTLKSYRTNPALIIGAEAGTSVVAAATGVVRDIVEDPVTGLTVTVEIGDGYTLVYGQLKEVQAKLDTLITVGETLGMIAEPTKYYTIEGENLYFRMLKDGEPVDPMLYLE